MYPNKQCSFQSTGGRKQLGVEAMRGTPAVHRAVFVCCYQLTQAIDDKVKQANVC
jgi:hypothetical protein